MKDKLIKKEEFPIGEADQVFFLAKKIYKNFGSITSGTLNEYAPTSLKALAIAPRLISAMRQGEFWQQLNYEIEDLVNKGKILEEYFETEQAKACYQEITNAFDDPSLDQKKFEALKNIFIKAFTEAISDSQLPLLFMRTINELSSNEVYFLGKCYLKFVNKDFDKTINSAQGWLKIAEETTGFPIGAITKIENNFINQGLIGDRIYSDRSGIKDIETFRLTDFAIDMCKFMSDTNSI